MGSHSWPKYMAFLLFVALSLMLASPLGPVAASASCLDVSIWPNPPIPVLAGVRVTSLCSDAWLDAGYEPVDSCVWAVGQDVDLGTPVITCVPTASWPTVPPRYALSWPSIGSQEQRLASCHVSGEPVPFSSSSSSSSSESATDRHIWLGWAHGGITVLHLASLMMLPTDSTVALGAAPLISRDDGVVQAFAGLGSIYNGAVDDDGDDDDDDDGEEEEEDDDDDDELVSNLHGSVLYAQVTSSGPLLHRFHVRNQPIGVPTASVERAFTLDQSWLLAPTDVAPGETWSHLQVGVSRAASFVWLSSEHNLYAAALPPTLAEAPTQEANVYVLSNVRYRPVPSHGDDATASYALQPATHMGVALFGSQFYAPAFGGVARLSTAFVHADAEDWITIPAMDADPSTVWYPFRRYREPDTSSCQHLVALSSSGHMSGLSTDERAPFVAGTSNLLQGSFLPFGVDDSLFCQELDGQIMVVPFQYGDPYPVLNSTTGQCEAGDASLSAIATCDHGGVWVAPNLPSTLTLSLVYNVLRVEDPVHLGASCLVRTRVSSSMGMGRIETSCATIDQGATFELEWPWPQVDHIDVANGPQWVSSPFPWPIVTTTNPCLVVDDSRITVRNSFVIMPNTTHLKGPSSSGHARIAAPRGHVCWFPADVVVSPYMLHVRTPALTPGSVAWDCLSRSLDLPPVTLAPTAARTSRSNERTILALSVCIVAFLGIILAIIFAVRVRHFRRMSLQRQRVQQGQQHQPPQVHAVVTHGSASQDGAALHSSTDIPLQVVARRGGGGGVSDGSGGQLLTKHAKRIAPPLRTQQSSSSSTSTTVPGELCYGQQGARLLLGQQPSTAGSSHPSTDATRGNGSPSLCSKRAAKDALLGHRSHAPVAYPKAPRDASLGCGSCTTRTDGDFSSPRSSEYDANEDTTIVAAVAAAAAVANGPMSSRALVSSSVADSAVSVFVPGLDVLMSVRGAAPSTARMERIPSPHINHDPSSRARGGNARLQQGTSGRFALEEDDDEDDDDDATEATSSESDIEEGRASDEMTSVWDKMASIALYGT